MVAFPWCPRWGGLSQPLAGSWLYWSCVNRGAGGSSQGLVLPLAGPCSGSDGTTGAGSVDALRLPAWRAVQRWVEGRGGLDDSDTGYLANPCSVAGTTKLLFLLKQMNEHKMWLLPTGYVVLSAKKTSRDLITAPEINLTGYLLLFVFFLLLVCSEDIKD